MTNLPYWFSSQNPDDGHENNPGGSGNPGPLGGPGGEFDFNQLGQMLSQLGQMLSQAGNAGSGPVNYDLAKQIAMQRLTGTSSPTSEQTSAVADAVRLAELWLDPVTSLPAGATLAQAWSARDWVERTLTTWQRLCDPVARRVSGAWVEALPAEAKEAAGPLLSMVGQMGGMAL